MGEVLGAVHGGRLAVRVGLQLSSVLRFFGIQRHGSRPRLALRDPPAPVSQLAVQGDGHRRVLPALAHLDVIVLSRLCLHSPGWQSWLEARDVSESDRHDDAVRAVARRELDLRRFWRIPRTAARAAPDNQGTVGASSAVGSSVWDLRSLAGWVSVLSLSGARHGLDASWGDVRVACGGRYRRCERTRRHAGARGCYRALGTEH